MRISSCYTFSPAVGIVLDICHPDNCISHCCFNFWFLKHKWFEHHFLCFFAVCISSWMRCLLRYLVYFLIVTGCFLSVEFQDFCIFSICLLSDLCFINIISKSVVCVLYSLTVFGRADIFNFNSLYYQVFISWIILLVSHLKFITNPHWPRLFVYIFF